MVSAYDFWQRRRVVLVILTLLILLMAGLYVLTAPLTHDVKSMLPDKNESFQKDFELFGYAPFARNILISLEVSDDGSQTPDPQEDYADPLIQTADKITALLKPPYFSRSISGITASQKLTLFQWLYDYLPCILTADDVARLHDRIEPAAVNRQLQENLRTLNSPESVVMKELITQDPLAFRKLLLDKLKFLSLVPNISVDDDHFISQDHRHLLIIAETPIAITDFGSSQKMLNYLYQVLDEHTLPGIRYRVICGHRYTVANSSTIQSDMWRVLIVSTAGLLLVLALFLRTRWVMSIFLIPLAALLIGTSATRCLFSMVSASTIGFGGVLLGLTDDYALHVFYGLQRENVSPRSVLGDLTKPLLYCALLSLSVFAVLLFSTLPGQRQLAVFCIVGIFTALLFALFVMPHLMPARPVVVPIKLSLPRTKAIALPVWILIVLISIVPAMRVRFDGNLRSIGIVPKDVLNDELAIKDSWGGVREQALVFSAAENSEEAMQKNDNLFQYIRKEMPNVSFLSLAALVPSQKTQQQNLKRWSEFWIDTGCKEALRDELERQGRLYGFNSSAFETFLKWIDKPRSAFTLSEFGQQCNDELLSPFVTELENGQFAVLTFVSDDKSVTEPLSNANLGVRVLSSRQFSEQLNRETMKEFVRFFTGSIVLIIALLAGLFRDSRKVILALLPVLTGIIIMLAIMSLFGICLNLFNVVAVILVLGLGVDYGIFIVSDFKEAAHSSTYNAVLVSGLTTFVGFGSLMVARHPALYSVGTTVSAGIIPSMLCALTLLPSLTRYFLSGNRTT